MKKIFTLLAATMGLLSASAQQHSAMTFAGKSVFYISAGSTQMGTTETASDTVRYEGSDLTLPSMKYNNMVIPSFTIKNTKYTGDHEGVTWADQPFTATVGGKEVKGSSLKGSFTHDGGVYKLSLALTFNYGDMPMPITYSIESYYVKPTTKQVSVVVGGSIGPYINPSVTYDARIYEVDGQKQLDIALHEYSLDGTVMGDILLGSHIIKGLTWNEEKGGYFRDYSQDGITFHFKTSQGMDGNYGFTKGGNLLVKMNGTDITYAENAFQPGAMPFPIVSTFGKDDATGIDHVTTTQQQASKSRKYISNGQLIIERDGKKYNVQGIEIR